MNRVTIYPGTFDPITLGHVDVVERGLKLFDHVILAVASNPGKLPMFDLETRLAMVRETFAQHSNVTITGFNGLLVDLAHQYHATSILRGLRAASDFEYEFQMATMNRRLDADIETAFVMAREDYTFVSSRFIREISSMGGDVSTLVPSPVLKHLQKAFNQS
ncbi:MAG: pantetheine-phosphate adenylyltransferase [Zetaproteobacteria bacterium CG_4_9_14_3_um_filter_49_83]|nr:MAG: pantetheine-phosphate adenylyltransferase [Zetaproteobacteria bacterium CG1_02_49_23]PIQ34939.1 MAG: pantetheine-phosphate adenylyltransferase [Zetaproteobacteria bacterium CG17_big_fil_post_rev_8_21_14_2_50_50_13]PIV31438.1 MAG: pantetheine-phosphate adenylyltransferase [Zetaproteobacteria bacterium CG02_land_8_20_14_3_00_50_9]PIY55039.1 MAG: pantetheine-phosphate adenylyltransferase [Zetaproteobacteria bacterium CG_4_10_14_0_8_um_filter_49_80]PJA36510.1 MAG: pantetheine-phosphate aden